MSARWPLTMDHYDWLYIYTPGPLQRSRHSRMDMQSSPDLDEQVYPYYAERWDWVMTPPYRRRTPDLAAELGRTTLPWL